MGTEAKAQIEDFKLQWPLFVKLAGNKGKNSPGARNTLGFTSPLCSVPAAVISFCECRRLVLAARE